jgi:hypothetical protein
MWNHANHTPYLEDDNEMNSFYHSHATKLICVEEVYNNVIFKDLAYINKTVGHIIAWLMELWHIGWDKIIYSIRKKWKNKNSTMSEQFQNPIETKLIPLTHIDVRSLSFRGIVTLINIDGI